MTTPQTNQGTAPQVGGGFTPGPWAVGRKTARLVFAGADGQGAPICECSGADETPRSEEVANARLIAAAPELLAVLHEVETYLAEREDVIDGDDGRPAPNAEMTLLREVRADSAKAICP
jgi:hypothetical protein